MFSVKCNQCLLSSVVLLFVWGFFLFKSLCQVEIETPSSSTKLVDDG